jgi:membrane protein required for colicin V production
VTLFDLIAGLILLASALVGLARGATREVTTVVAFVVAVMFAVLGLRFVSPIMQQAIHIVWMANTAGVLLLFLFAYVVLRLAGGALSRRVQQTAGLSGFDRVLGLLVGVVRGLVVIGGFALLLNAIMPEPRPDWLTKARLYPVAQMVGNGLRAFAPKNLRAVGETAGPEASKSPGDQTPGHDKGYSRRDRKSLDVMVEKSR